MSGDSCLQKVGQTLFRTKLINFGTIGETKLARCLGTLDLTLLGIGSTLGAGIYVVAGQVAKTHAGPAIILSFAIAAIASIFAGLCYAEFGARVPKTGSAYIYSYVTVGEFWAFIIGWNLILSYVIGTASVARAWSSYFDSIIGNKILPFFNQTMHMDVNTLAEYPDFFAFGVTILLTIILCVGVKEISMVNNVFTCVNLLVVSYVIICGLFKAHLNNWQLTKEEVQESCPVKHGDPPDLYGEGGFFPYGLGGMFHGASMCFYAFVGFDIIATTGEEVKNPQRAIPIAIVACLSACFLAYFGVSATITLMEPYCMLDDAAALPQVFAHVGWNMARYVIAIGAISGLTSSLLGGMFPMPRVIYAMAEDGLLFNWLTWVPERVKTPVAATMTSGVLAATMAMMFDLGALVEMMSIGTLVAYSLVAMCILILRYRVVLFESYEAKRYRLSTPSANFTQSTLAAASDPSVVNVAIPNVDILGISTASRESSMLVGTAPEGFLTRVFSHRDDFPSDFSEQVAKIIIGILCCLVLAFASFLVYREADILAVVPWAVAVAAVLFAAILLCLIIIGMQPENREAISFKVPWVPVVPALSMFVNIYLMLNLSATTWVRFSVWLGIGFLIYFTYGIWHSKEGKRSQLLSETDEDEEINGDTPSLHRDHTGMMYEGT